MRDGEDRSRQFAKQLHTTLTDAETILWSRLQRRQLDGLHFRKQHPIGPYVADFACVQATLVIELDGATHSTDEEIEYDRRRTAYLRKRGWNELRFTNFAIYNNLDNVLEHIEREAMRVAGEAAITADH